MDKVFVFKISEKERKSKWKQIEILESQTLGQLDVIIRKAFCLDLHDHLSEFFRSKALDQTGFGEIEPGGTGTGSKPRITQIGLKITDALEYIYDYGSSSFKTVTLIEIKDAETNTKYPLISIESKPRNIYCKSCRESGKKTKAEFVVFFRESMKQEKLCKECVKFISKNKAYINRIIG
jgi:hypothetical protein